MKRYCKNIDITNREFVSNAVRDCLTGSKGKNKKSKLSRRDTIILFAEYSGKPIDYIKGIVKTKQHGEINRIIELVIDGIIEEIKVQNYKVKPIWYTTKIDGCSGKERRIGIQGIKQQLYDYIAVYALDEVLGKKIGFYQCSAIPKKGQLMGARTIARWLKNTDMRYAWKGDIQHFYESIDKEVLMSRLKKCVKDKPLLHLVQFLINTFDKGLAIGSFLSQYLANFYLSYAYHYASEKLFKIRRKKDGRNVRVKLCYHVLFYMDDLLLIGKSLSDLKMAARRLMKFISDELHVKVKDSYQFIDLDTGYIDMMGYKVSRKCMTIRSRIFKRARRAIVSVVRFIHEEKPIPLKLAQRTVSLYGWIKNSNSRRFSRRYHVADAVRASKKTIGGKAHEKNEIRQSNAADYDSRSGQWQERCCLAC